MTKEQVWVEVAVVSVLQADAKFSVVATLCKGEFAVELYPGVNREVIQAICRAMESC